MKRIITFLLLIMALPAMAASTAVAAAGPEQLIKQTSDKVLAEIKVNAEVYRSDPTSLYQLVDEVVLPHFDFGAMTDMALGRYKDKVTAEQKPAIVSEFRRLLVRTSNGTGRATRACGAGAGRSGCPGGKGFVCAFGYSIRGARAVFHDAGQIQGNHFVEG